MTPSAKRSLRSNEHAYWGPGIVLGDSVSARNPTVASKLANPAQHYITDCAIPGYTTIGQIGKLDALSSSIKTSAEWVLLATGLNDRLGTSNNSAAMISGYQSAVDHIRNVCPQAKVIVAQMNPAFSFFDQLLGPEGASAVANYKAEWVALNNAIAGFGSTPIVNVHARATGHLSLLMDPNYANSLNPTYQENPGDVHQNPAGSLIIALAGWQPAIQTVGQLQ